FRAEQAKLHLTDEKSLRRVYGLKGPAKMPLGFPVVWEQPGTRLVAATSERVPLSKISTDPATSALPFEIRPDRSREPDGAREETRHVVTGFYRGRRFEMVSPVVLHHRPDLTGFLPEMPKT